MGGHRGKVFGYVRVSGAEQGNHGTSLGAQQDEIVKYCKAQGLPKPTFHVEVESAGAGKEERRVELQTLLRTVAPGDLVLVTKVDRWSRNLVFGVDSVRALVKRGIGFRSIGEGIDASTSQGDSTLGIMSWVADMERQRIRERTVGARIVLRDSGCYVEGVVPIGYQRVDRRLVIEPDDAKAIRELYRRCIQGHTLRQLTGWFRDSYPLLHGWDYRNIGQMLRSRVYIGEQRTSRGVWRPVHEAIVDRATWERAQAALEERKHKGRTPGAASLTSSWLLRSYARCADCGSLMGAAYGGYDSAVRSVYYACRKRLDLKACSAQYVRVDEADAQFGEIILDRLKALSHELSKAAPPEDDTVEPAREGEAERLAKRRERLLDLAADGLLSADDLRKRLKKVDEEIGRAAVRAADAVTTRAAAAPELRSSVLADLRLIAKAWSRLEAADRRQIVMMLAADVRIAKEREPTIQWRPASDLVKDRSEGTCLLRLIVYRNDPPVGAVKRRAKPLRKGRGR